MKVRPVILSPCATEAAWTAATARVQRYLQAHRLTQSDQVAGLAADVVAIARTRWLPGEDPTVTAMATLEACMTAWFSQLLPTEERRATNALHWGRVGLAVGDVPAQWAAHFLRDAGVPQELVRGLRAADLGRAPAIRLSHMAASRPVTPRASQADAWYFRPFSRGAAVLQRVISVVSAAFAGGR